MPELPEVQTVVDTLRPIVSGAHIRAIVHLREDIVSPADVGLVSLLAGRRIKCVDRRAKRMVFTLDDGNRFYIHLGMSGRLTAEPPDAPILIHTHLIAELCLNRNTVQLRFRDPRRFGGIFWMGKLPDPEEIGPEPFDITSVRLEKILATTARPIKSALLDQKLIAGLGNIYADEALFAAGIHPTLPANQLSKPQVAALNRAIRQVLKRAIRHKGSTLRDFVDSHGNKGSFQRLHRVYGRGGEPCIHCKAPLHRIVLAGRSTHFCPQCQPI